MEDIESNFAQLNILLKKRVYYSWVRNGQEAINSFIREKPDLILMDIRMPDDGWHSGYREDSNYFSFGSYYCSQACAFYTEQQQAILQGWMQCSYLKPYSLEKL